MKQIKDVKELLSQQMTRKEFLQLLGVAILSVLGVNTFISSLMRNAKQTQKTQEVSEASRGFGSRKFGA